MEGHTKNGFVSARHILLTHRLRSNSPLYRVVEITVKAQIGVVLTVTSVWQFTTAGAQIAITREGHTTQEAPTGTVVNSGLQTLGPGVIGT